MFGWFKAGRALCVPVVAALTQRLSVSGTGWFFRELVLKIDS